MHVRSHILEAHAVYPRRPLEDGDFGDADQIAHHNLDYRFLQEVDRKSDLTAFTGYTAYEVSVDDDAVVNGAVIEILFSKRKQLAAVLYDHPCISDAFIEWVFCSSAEDAITQWRKRVRVPQLRAPADPIEMVRVRHSYERPEDEVGRRRSRRALV